MPCIQVTTNKTITAAQQQQMKASFGKAIELIPRKTENWLMCVFRPECGMWFRGEATDLAFLEVDVFGTLDREPCCALTEALTEIVSRELNIPADQIYIKYAQTPHWGWNGKNF